jgi:calpain
VSDEDKEQIGLKFDHDGEFWISFDDYMANFDTLEICNLGPEVMDEIQDMVGARPKTAGEWKTDTHHTAWVTGRSAGGCRNYLDTFPTNPQVSFSLKDADPYDDDNLCSCILSVVQKYRRQLRHKGLDMLAIGFAIYQVNGRPGNKMGRDYFGSHKAVGRSPVFINLREVCGRFRFPPGDYIMVPSTFEPNQQSDFMVRVFSEGPLESEIL